VTNSERLTHSEKAALAAFLASHGHRRACACVGLARMTVYRALRGDEPMRQATLTQIRLSLSLVSQIGGVA
jgi:hypothetical protein